MRAEGWAETGICAGRLQGKRGRELDHERRLQLELAKTDPDLELIEFWRREINAAKKRKHD
jgi:hypothetical protein